MNTLTTYFAVACVMFLALSFLRHRLCEWIGFDFRDDFSEDAWLVGVMLFAISIAWPLALLALPLCFSYVALGKLGTPKPADTKKERAFFYADQRINASITIPAGPDMGLGAGQPYRKRTVVTAKGLTLDGSVFVADDKTVVTLEEK